MTEQRRVAVVCAGTGWHESDLVRAGRSLGAQVELVDFRELQARLGGATQGDGARLSSASLDLTQADRVLVRTMPAGSLEQIVFRMDFLGQLLGAGIPVINSPRSLEAAVDKYLASARLEAASLPVPPTRVTQSPEAALTFFEELGGDVIVKPLFGSQGKGQERLTSRRCAEERFRELAGGGAVLYLQKFIAHPGHDLRLFTCGHRVLAAMRRTAAVDWRTNAALGGRATAVQPEAALEDLALRAAAALGTEVAGVDLLPDADGAYWVLEVNGVPGWRALAAACGIDVARAVLEHALEESRAVADGRAKRLPPSRESL